MQKDAWNRKYNSWRNQEERRREAKLRWAQRHRIAASEAAGEYCFGSEYKQQTTRLLKRARHRENWHTGLIESRRAKRRTRRAARLKRKHPQAGNKLESAVSATAVASETEGTAEEDIAAQRRALEEKRRSRLL